jgi:hypothetical protein
MKWTPFLSIALAGGGLASTFILPIEMSWMGMTFMSVATGTCATYRIKGPLRQVSLSEPDDEREQAWRDQANLNAYGAVSIMAMLGIGLFGGWMILSFLHGHGVSPLKLGTSLMAFAMFLFTLFLVLPTLFASWSMPDIVEDEPEVEDRLSFLKPRRPRF